MLVCPFCYRLAFFVTKNFIETRAFIFHFVSKYDSTARINRIRTRSNYWWMFGHSEREIEEKTGQPKTTIHDTIERYRETGTATPVPRTGRPPILNDRDQRHLVRIIRSDRQQTTRQVHNNFVETTGTAVSLSTIKRALCDAGYNSRVAARNP